MSVNLRIIIQVIVLKLCSAGFSTGRIKEGSFEYSTLNGWMTPKEAVKLCEEDVGCAGFTFHGVLIEDVEFEMYFFSYIPRIHFNSGHPSHWAWTSYKVSRDFVLFPGILINAPDYSRNKRIRLGFDMTQDPARAERICFKMAHCASLVQVGKSDEVAVQDSVFFSWRYNTSHHSTLISLHADVNQVFDTDVTAINMCCPEVPWYTDIDISNTEIPMDIAMVDCKISKQEFHTRFVKRRVPVLLQGCLPKSWFPDPVNNNDQRFAGLNFREILQRLFDRGNDTSTIVSRPKLRRNLIDKMRAKKFKISYKQAEAMYEETMNSQENLKHNPSFTHTRTPNDAHSTYKEMLEALRKWYIRVFLKLSNLKSKLDCYQKYRLPGTEKLLKGHEKCLVLDGFWKPPPMPDDLYARTKYDNDLAWIIMSAQSTGSQLHKDPDHTGAWNLLLTGRKWWAVLPYRAMIDDFTCDTSCSHESWKDGSMAYTWFKHILPQLKDKKFYGKRVVEFVQQPGDVLYLPNGMPHTIFNIDDNVALTENYLFDDGVSTLVRSMALDKIRDSVPWWDEAKAYRYLYNQHADKLLRKEMRETYHKMTSYASKYGQACD
jgi:hypothetical protein